jgi:acetyl/propionyl-CoA carboxylase alpha subunit
VVLKAAAGGGGKGMRLLRRGDQAIDAIQAARREAERAFGDGALYVERLIDQPRHVEVQIIGDTRGQIVHLFERDCTLQRRHQKVIEEAPAPRLAPRIRARLLDTALAAGRAVGYVNAGTIECLVEGEGDDARVYFLEMNTRLQVEHPITEAITGIDLVRVQILVASGAPLPFSQSDIHVSGHAIECRVYAEDSRRLLPQAGRLLFYREPAGEGVRVDAGVEAGQTVPVHYDPLLAKVIAHGRTREEARARMIAALRGYDILGLRHNIAFLLALLARDEVRDSRVHTRFIEELPALLAPPDAAVVQAAAALAAFAAARETDPPAAVQADGEAVRDPWDLLGPGTW